VEGWTTLGAMLGVVPRTVEVTEIHNGVFEATVELIRANDGMVVGRGIAECGDQDEVDRNGNPIWASRPRYSRKSMAITRATGKAFRLSFSWIMKLAGFEPTPFEDMPGEIIEGEAKEVKEEKPKSNGGKSWPAYMVHSLTKNDNDNPIAPNPQNAIAILNLFPDLPLNTSGEKVTELGLIYRARRNDGLEIAEAAKIAWSEWKDN
jgi:hypothetical protein